MNYGRSNSDPGTWNDQVKSKKLQNWARFDKKASIKRMEAKQNEYEDDFDDDDDNEEEGSDDNDNDDDDGDEEGETSSDEDINALLHDQDDDEVDEREKVKNDPSKEKDSKVLEPKKNMPVDEKGKEKKQEDSDEEDDDYLDNGLDFIKKSSQFLENEGKTEVVKALEIKRANSISHFAEVLIKDDEKARLHDDMGTTSNEDGNDEEKMNLKLQQVFSHAMKAMKWKSLTISDAYITGDHGDHGTSHSDSAGLAPETTPAKQLEGETKSPQFDNDGDQKGKSDELEVKVLDEGNATIIAPSTQGTQEDPESQQDEERIDKTQSNTTQEDHQHSNPNQNPNSHPHSPELDLSIALHAEQTPPLLQSCETPIMKRQSTSQKSLNVIISDSAGDTKSKPTLSRSSSRLGKMLLLFKTEKGIKDIAESEKIISASAPSSLQKIKVCKTLDVLRAKSLDAEEVIARADELWRNKFKEQMNQQLEAQKEKQRSELQSIKKQYITNLMKLQASQVESDKKKQEENEFIPANCLDTLERVDSREDRLKNRYLEALSLAKERHPQELLEITKQYDLPLSRMDRILEAQLCTIKTFVTRAEHAVDHCVRVTESSEGKRNEMIKYRVKKATDEADLIVNQALREVAAVCEKTMRYYKTDTALYYKRNGLSLPTGVTQADRLPTIPSPDKVILTPIKKKGTKARPSSAPVTKSLSRDSLLHSDDGHDTNKNVDYQFNETMGGSNRILPGQRPVTALRRRKMSSSSVNGNAEGFNVKKDAQDGLDGRDDRDGQGQAGDVEYEDDLEFYEDTNDTNEDFEGDGLANHLGGKGLTEWEDVEDRGRGRGRHRNQESFDDDNDIDDNNYNENDNRKKKTKRRMRRKKNKNRVSRDKEMDMNAYANTNTITSSAKGPGGSEGVNTRTDPSLTIPTYSDLSQSYNATYCTLCDGLIQGTPKYMPHLNGDRAILQAMRRREADEHDHEAIEAGKVSRKQKMLLRYRNHYRNTYNIKPKPLEEFCSWECVKKRLHQTVSNTRRYELNLLIDLHAGYVVYI